jgi:hypothetical protein
MKKVLVFTIFILVVLSLTTVRAQSCTQPGSLVSVTKRKSGRTEYAIFTLKMPTTVAPGYVYNQSSFHGRSERKNVSY